MLFNIWLKLKEDPVAEVLLIMLCFPCILLMLSFVPQYEKT